MLTTLEFWLSFNNGAERFLLPVNPPSVKINSSHGYEDVEVNELGEYTIIKGSKLKGVSFEAFFPLNYDASYCNTANLKAPWDYVEILERWKKSGKPMRLTITGTPINMAVTIRNFEYDESAGAVGDVNFILDFKEFTFIQFRTIDTSNGSSPTSDRPDTRQKEGTYTIVSGDSLWKIAKENNTTYTALAELNAIKAPYIIQPGQVIRLT
jgi:LysM repeat protein